MIHTIAVRLAAKLLCERTHLYKRELIGLVGCLKRYHILKDISDEDLMESAEKAADIVFNRHKYGIEE